MNCFKMEEDKIKKYLKDKNYKKAYPLMMSAICSDMKNITLIDSLASEFKKCKLYNELIEIYKLDFQYTLNPKYFEKIGDLYFKIGDLESASENYFNYAETSKPVARIYNKLAKVFEKQGDIDSMKTCLAQAELLEGSNG